MTLKTESFWQILVTSTSAISGLYVLRKNDTPANKLHTKFKTNWFSCEKTPGKVLPLKPMMLTPKIIAILTAYGLLDGKLKCDAVLGMRFCFCSEINLSNLISYALTITCDEPSPLHNGQVEWNFTWFGDHVTNSFWLNVGVRHQLPIRNILRCSLRQLIDPMLEQPS